MKQYFKLLIAILIPFLASCEKENEEPLNTVFALISPDKTVSVTNGGLNVVANVAASTTSIEIPVSGTFINAIVKEDCSWLNAKIENKTLVISLNFNYSEEPRTGLIEIKANDTNQIVDATVIVNQAKPTASDYDEMERLDFEYMVGYYGTPANIPADKSLEKNVLYKLNPEGTAYMIIYFRSANPERIKRGDVVYPHYSVCDINTRLNFPKDYFQYSFLTNKSTYTTDFFTYNGITQDLLNKFGLGILLPLENGICYGDDFDLILTSDTGLPSLKANKEVYIYVVRYYKNDKYQPQPNYAPAKLIRR